MLILGNNHIPEKSNGLSIAAVFGVGLLGFHIVENLNRYQYKITRTLPFSWEDSSSWSNERDDIIGDIEDLLNAPPGKKMHESCFQTRIDFIWSAGKGGFGMKKSDALSEKEAFSKVLELALDVSRKNPSCLVRFHMVSSAGGLFEGQTNVTLASIPEPRRPYGSLKLSQEKILDDCNGLIRFIYRPTSVYGFAGLNHRLGLIPTLLWNGSKNKVSTIFGAPETLRDYVWADDVGAFMAGVISSQKALSDQFILAAGKPSALFEIFNRIEKILNKKLFRHYIKTGGNAEHNTFSMNTRPLGWNPLDLETGIRKTYIAMLKS